MEQEQEHTIHVTGALKEKELKKLFEAQLKMSIFQNGIYYKILKVKQT